MHISPFLSLCKMASGHMSEDTLSQFLRPKRLGIISSSQKLTAVSILSSICFPEMKTFVKDNRESFRSFSSNLIVLEKLSENLGNSRPGVLDLYERI